MLYIISVENSIAIKSKAESVEVYGSASTASAKYSELCAKLGQNNVMLSEYHLEKNSQAESVWIVWRDADGFQEVVFATPYLHLVAPTIRVISERGLKDLFSRKLTIKR